MSPIWTAFELVGAGARTMPHWEKGLGVDDLGLLRPYLAPLPTRATTLPCERTFRGCGCRYRIVEHDDDTIVGICDEGRCERRSFTTDESNVTFTTGFCKTFNDFLSHFRVENTST